MDVCGMAGYSPLFTAARIHIGSSFTPDTSPVLAVYLPKSRLPSSYLWKFIVQAISPRMRMRLSLTEPTTCPIVVHTKFQPAVPEFLLGSLPAPCQAQRPVLRLEMPDRVSALRTWLSPPH